MSINKIIIIIIIFFLHINFLYPQYKSDFRVTDDQTNKRHNSSRIAIDKDGNFVVVWQDKRNSQNLNPIYDIYGQRFNYKGEPQGANFKVNAGNDNSGYPNICMRYDGSFVVGWREGISINGIIDSSNFYIRIYNKFGDSLSERIKLNDYYDTHLECVAIGILNNNDIICSFTQYADYITLSNLYYQKVSSIGQKIGNNVIVNDDTLYTIQDNSDIIVRTDNSFIITWTDNRFHYTGPHDIFMQKYSSAGQKIGNNIKVNDDNAMGIDHLLPQISCDSSGRFAIVWNDPRETSGSFFDVFCQFYNSDGTPSGSNFRVPFGFYEWMRYRPSLCFRKDGNLVIGWGDEYANGAGESPFFLRFSPTNQIIGYQHAVTNYYPAQMKIYNDIALWKDRIITTWVDYRNGGVSDIYCNILSFQNPDSVISNIIPVSGTAKDFYLSQNYPNPFNPSTFINFTIPKKELVSLNVYDIQGRLIKTLINNETRTEGTYSVKFDGSHLASGVYFYKLTAGNNSDIKSMVLIK